jgi:hypothetical protein
LKKNRNRVKPTGFGSFFREKTDSNQFGSVFPVLARFFGLAGFSRFGLVFFPVSVRFFRFSAYKTETEPNRPVFSKF